ncbi:hypothetical protein ANN_01056 [Periplaneta americana]|uniref:Reverse transcriptase domain-containing protein n=1 Tax=Periplaneta americana TaxID=6978 RepID=A0ABQ8TSK3_PERAM|nr:hypothetical protein ANN_01056 [Periplaneta americana]
MMALLLSIMSRQRIFVPKRTADRVVSSGSYIYYVTWMRKQGRIANSFSIILSSSTISNTAWMDSYLRERQQCVSINNRYSTWRTTKTGVPQGSVLGPLLFSIYINDISSNLTSCRHHIYADDIQIYLHTRPNYINDAITKVNDDLNSISIWSKTHGLNLNASKSQAILIEHQRSKCDKQNLPPIIVNNTIPYSTTVKNLGIYMDCHLEWNEQVNHTSKKIFSIIHSLKRLKNFLPDKLKLILVQTLVMPHFDYCDIILSNLNANLSNRLQRVHNACVRYICNIRKYDHVSRLSKLCLG